MRAKLIYVLSALMMVAMLLVTSCSKGEDESTPPKKRQTYTVTFDTNGGEGTMPAQIVEEERVTPLNINTFTCTDDYKFSRWNTEEDDSGTNYYDGDGITLSADIVLYAQWAEACTVTFDANGGDGTMAAQVVEKGIVRDLNANTFTRADYRFVCWNTKADGTGEDYTDKKRKAFEADITLYAKWLAVSPTDLFLVDIDAANIPEGNVWTIVDTDITAADSGDKFAGLRAALVALEDSRNVEVIFPNLMTLPSSALSGCEATAEWTFSAPNVVKVNSSAFNGTDNLTEVYLPKATDFGLLIFRDNTSLVTLTIATESRVEKLYDRSFYYFATENIDLTTHSSNVDGLIFKYTNSKLSTPFKSVNGVGSL